MLITLPVRACGATAWKPCVDYYARACGATMWKPCAEYFACACGATVWKPCAEYSAHTRGTPSVKGKYWRVDPAGLQCKITATLQHCNRPPLRYLLE